MRLRHKACAFIALCLAVTLGFGQEAELEDAFPGAGLKEPWLLDWGGELSAALLFEGQALAPALAAGAGAKLWLRLSLPEQWQLYIRARDNASLQLYPMADILSSLSNRWEISDAFLQLLVRDAPFTLAVGRKNYTLGTGLALSGAGDGLEVELFGKAFSAKAFGYYTGLISPEFSRYAMFLPDDALGTKRYIGSYSVSGSMKGHELSVLGLYQGYFGSRAEEYYTSWYSGLQAKGLLLGGDYLVEGYTERGYSPLGTGRGDIRAYAARAGYARSFLGALSPRLSLGYAFASGDEDRISGQGPAGNQAGFDEAFQSFGNVDTGLVLRLYFSNLHMASASAGATIKKINIGLNYYYFAKHKKESPINTADALLPFHDLGHELDAVLSWSPFLDLSFLLGGGLFLPGKAFSSGNELRYAASIGLSLSY
ncbi:MAG TPA: hypothetical protein DCG47_14655 [Spirochaetaceae bacterium]|jgi:hypothetical protein|nr:hypothetical protein [Spirochaetaceae bacterium]